MKVAFGFKAHSGWAALVVVGDVDGKLLIFDRRRVELVEEKWAKQPYHAADGLNASEARLLVRRGVAAARTIAAKQMRSLLRRERERENDVVACGVLVSDPMPAWSTHEILAVHFRMHKAEGVLFRDVLVRAAAACKLLCVTVPEKSMINYAQTIGLSGAGLVKTIDDLRKSVGPPWGKDQKDAAFAAAVALHRAQSTR